MRLLYENENVAVFVTKEGDVVVINKEVYNDIPGCKVIGTLFYQNHVIDVERGSYIDDEVTKWVKGLS